MNVLPCSSSFAEIMTVNEDGDLPNPFPPFPPTRPSRALLTHQEQQPPMTKQSKFLSLVLQITVMAIVLSVFLIFMGIGVLVLIHICIACRCFRRSRNSETNGYRSGLSEIELRKLPCFEYGFEGGSSDCAVCLDGFQKGDRCRRLPVCKHVFHACCIDSWFRNTPVCPICRTAVDSSGLMGGDVFDQSEGSVYACV